MEIDVFFVREKILTKQLSIVHIPTLDQWTDILTKPLSTSRFEALRRKLNVKNVVTKPLSTSRFEALRSKLNVKNVSNENSPP